MDEEKILPPTWFPLGCEYYLNVALLTDVCKASSWFVNLCRVGATRGHVPVQVQCCLHREHSWVPGFVLTSQHQTPTRNKYCRIAPFHL